MLKRLLLVTMALAVIGACTPPPPPLPTDRPDAAADEAKLKFDLQRWMDDFNAGNVDSLARQYADDAVLMPPNGPAANGRAAIRTALDNEVGRAVGLTFTNSATTGVGVSGDLAWMSGHYAVVDAKGTTVELGKYLSVHRHFNGAWLYIRHTWNVDKLPPPPPPPAKK
jgi:ketosteroid isomerase-like protein